MRQLPSNFENFPKTSIIIGKTSLLPPFQIKTDWTNLAYPTICFGLVCFLQICLDWNTFSMRNMINDVNTKVASGVPINIISTPFNVLILLNIKG